MTLGAMQASRMHPYTAHSRVPRNALLDQCWTILRHPLLSTLHLLAGFTCLVAVLRKESSHLHLPAGLLHLYAAYICVNGQPPSARDRITSSILTGVAWFLRHRGYVGWAGHPMKIVAYNAYKNGSGYVADWLCCAMCEQVNLLLLAPPIVVVAALAWHQRAVLLALQNNHLQPHLAILCIWAVAELLAPHMVLCLARKQLPNIAPASSVPQAQRAGLQTAAGAEGKAQDATGPVTAGAPGQGDTGAGASGTSGSDAHLLQKQREAELDLAAIGAMSQTAQQQPASTQETTAPASSAPPGAGAATSGAGASSTREPSCTSSTSQTGAQEAGYSGMQGVPVNLLTEDLLDACGLSCAATSPQLQPLLPSPPASVSGEPGTALTMCTSEPASTPGSMARSAPQSQGRKEGGTASSPEPEASSQEQQPGEQQEHMQRSVQQQQPGPQRHTLQSLSAARSLIQRATAAARTYRSPCLQSQVAIKLDVEPDQLAADVIQATTQVLHSQGRVSYQVVRGGLRRGCSLLKLDLLGRHLSEPCDMEVDITHANSSLHTILLQEATLKALLGSLLPPGAPPPAEGSVAHVCCEGQVVDLQWQQGAWVVTKDPFASSSFTLLHVDQPVTRLPSPIEPALQPHVSSGLAAGQGATQHRVTLLLSSQESLSELSFCGSDGWGAATPDTALQAFEAESTAGQAQLVTCVAQGPWGSFLPVSVAAMQGSHGRTTSDSPVIGGVGAPNGHSICLDTDVLDGVDGSPLTALTLDVDLRTAAYPGAIQLQLWQGHILLASAPLLLLPPPQSDTVPVPDSLLTEVQQCLSCNRWEQEETVAGGHGSGNSAWLSDLGQVLYTAAVIRQTSGTGAVVVTPEGPGAWGGVAASMAMQCTDNHDLISRIIDIGEGLVEYAQQEGLAHVEALVTSCITTLQGRLSEAGFSNSAGPGVQHPEEPVASSDMLQQSTAVNTLRHRIHAGDAGSSSGKRREPGSFDSGDGSEMKGSQSTKMTTTDDISTASGIVLSQKHARHHQQQRQAPLPLGMRMRSMPLRRAAHAVVWGFPEGQEGSYAIWVAKHTSPLVATVSVLCLLQITVIAVRSCWSAPDWKEPLTDSAVHLLYALPHVVNLVITYMKLYRLREPGLLFHAFLKTVVGCASTFGVPFRLAFPRGYSANWRARLDVWTELLYAPGRPMRLPALVFANTLLFACYMGLCHHHSPSLAACFPRAFLPRLPAIAVGAALDLWRRAAFLQEVQQHPT